jgi:hypothetical protein
MRFDERLPERVAKALTAPKDVLRQRIDETGIGIAEPNSLGPSRPTTNQPRRLSR